MDHFTVAKERSGESTHLPPMWLRIDTQTRCHMWVEFVVVGCLLCFKRCFSIDTLVLPSPQTNISKFQFNPDFSGPIATANSHYYYLLFACLTAWSLNESEAGFDLLLIQPSLLFLCKYLLFSMRTASLT